MRLLLPLLALLATPTFAQDDAPNPTSVDPGDVPDEPTPPVERPTEAQLDEHIAPLKSGDPRAALDTVTDKLADASLAVLAPDLFAVRGDRLAELGHAHAAVEAWARSLERAPEAGVVRIDALLELAEPGDRRRAEDALVGVPVDDPLGDLYVARALLRAGEHEAAVARSKRVEKSSKHFPAAKLVEGAALSQARNHSGALAAFATADARNVDPSERWQRALEVNLARTYFALGNQPKALDHYAKVDRGAPNWTHVHFETAWAQFRMGDMAGALGTLHSVDSPFFADGYWAEAQLLEAYALFYMCKFPSAKERIDAFEIQWTPVRDALDGARKVTPTQAWEDRLRVRAGDPPAHLPVQVLDRYTWDVRASDTETLIEAMTEESAALREAGLEASAAMLDERLEALRIAEGKRILGHASAIREELTGMLQDIEITKLDLLDLQKRLYQSAAVSADLGMGNPLGDIRTIRQQGGAQVWPFEGEYWADEVGYYRVTARSDCPPDLQIGGR